MRKTVFCNFKLRAIESFGKYVGNWKGSCWASPRQQYWAAALNGLSHPGLEPAHRPKGLQHARHKPPTLGRHPRPVAVPSRQPHRAASAPIPAAPGVMPHPHAPATCLALSSWRLHQESTPYHPNTRLLPIPHITAAIPAPLCVEGRWRVFVLPASPSALLVHYRCPESALILGSSCAAVMCLWRTTVSSTVGLTVERHRRSSSCPAATSSRTALSHCYFPDLEPAAPNPVPCRHRRASQPESRRRGELHMVSPSSPCPSNWFTALLSPSSRHHHQSSPPIVTGCGRPPPPQMSWAGSPDPAVGYQPMVAGPGWSHEPVSAHMHSASFHLTLVYFLNQFKFKFKLQNLVAIQINLIQIWNQLCYLNSNIFYRIKMTNNLCYYYFWIKMLKLVN
jgi:hypothetical protein